MSLPAGRLINRVEMGLRLRAARKQKKLALRHVAESSGVSLPTLSKMELGQVSISYEKFVAVARALHIDISEFFDPGENGRPRAPTFSRSDPKQVPNYTSDHYDHQMLASDYPHKKMTPAYSRIWTRKLEDFPDYNRHPGEEFLLVLSGSVQVCFETGETVTLAKSESLYFNSGIGHVYLAVGRKDAHVLMVMSHS